MRLWLTCRPMLLPCLSSTNNKSKLKGELLIFSFQRSLEQYVPAGNTLANIDPIETTMFATAPTLRLIRENELPLDQMGCLTFWKRLTKHRYLQSTLYDHTIIENRRCHEIYSCKVKLKFKNAYRSWCGRLTGAFLPAPSPVVAPRRKGCTFVLRIKINAIPVFILPSYHPLHPLEKENQKNIECKIEGVKLHVLWCCWYSLMTKWPNHVVTWVTSMTSTDWNEPDPLPASTTSPISGILPVVPDPTRLDLTLDHGLPSPLLLLRVGLARGSFNLEELFVNVSNVRDTRCAAWIVIHTMVSPTAAFFQPPKRHTSHRPEK